MVSSADSRQLRTKIFNSPPHPRYHWPWYPGLEGLTSRVIKQSGRKYVNYVLPNTILSPLYLHDTVGSGFPLTRQSIKWSLWIAGCWGLGAWSNVISSKQNEIRFRLSVPQDKFSIITWFLNKTAKTAYHQLHMIKDKWAVTKKTGHFWSHMQDTRQSKN